MMKEKLTEVLTLPKYQETLEMLDVNTQLMDIDWTPARLLIGLLQD